MIRKILAALPVLSLAVASFATFQATANATEGNLSYDFLSCVKNSKTGSVVILMDESGSIYDSDPDTMRITGAQILIDDLQRVADVSQGDIKVQLAGLGDNFVSRSNGWATLAAYDTSTAGQLKSLAEQSWTTKPADGNNRETDMLSSLAGAQKVLQPEVGCKLLVLFKDGKDWQSLNPNNTSPVDFPAVQAAINSGDFIQAKREALNELCRPRGVADGFRANNVNMLAVALGDGGFDELRDLVDGKTCGERPGVGSVLSAINPGDLPSLFRRALDPSYEPSEFTGSFDFQMSSDLQGITVLTSGLDSIADLAIKPPDDCPAVQLPSDRSGREIGQMSSGVLWQATPYGNSGTVQVSFQNANRTNAECWDGGWSVSTGNQSARSVVEVDPNLEAIAIFEDGDVYLVPGSETPTNYQVRLQQLSDGTSVPASSLGEDSEVVVEGYLIDEDGNSVALFAQGPLQRSGLESPISWTLPENVEYGNYKLVLSTSLNIPGVELASKTVTWERDIEVRGEIAAPVVVNAPINFGEIDGVNRSSAEVEVMNRSDKELVILFEETELALDQGPADLNYEISGPTENVVLPAGGTVKFRVELTPVAERVDAFGAVGGELEMMAAVSDALAKKAPFSGDFFGVQKASADETARFWLIVIFMLLAALGTLGSIALVNYLASRFPKSADVNKIEAFTADVNVSQYGIELTSGELEDRIYRDTWNQVEFVNRREVRVDGTTINAKSPGLKLSGNGFGLANTPTFGWGSESANMQAGSRIGLALEGGYLVSTELSGAEVAQKMQADGSVPAKLTLFTQDRTKSEQIFNMASSSPALASLTNLETSSRASREPKEPKVKKTKSQATQAATESDSRTQQSQAAAADNDDFW